MIAVSTIAALLRLHRQAAPPAAGSLCVDGSTNAPSSLSGNATLFNNGNPSNVTDFMPEQSGGGSGRGGGGGGKGSGGNGNGAGRLVVSSIATICAVAAAVLIL